MVALVRYHRYGQDIEMIYPFLTNIIGLYSRYEQHITSIKKGVVMTKTKEQEDQVKVTAPSKS